MAQSSTNPPPCPPPTTCWGPLKDSSRGGPVPPLTPGAVFGGCLCSIMRGGCWDPLNSTFPCGAAAAPHLGGVLGFPLHPREGRSGPPCTNRTLSPWGGPEAQGERGTRVCPLCPSPLSPGPQEGADHPKSSPGCPQPPPHVTVPPGTLVWGDLGLCLGFPPGDGMVLRGGRGSAPQSHQCFPVRGEPSAMPIPAGVLGVRDVTPERGPQSPACLAPGGSGRSPPVVPGPEGAPGRGGCRESRPGRVLPLHPHPLAPSFPLCPSFPGSILILRLCPSSSGSILILRLHHCTSVLHPSPRSTFPLLHPHPPILHPSLLRPSSLCSILIPSSLTPPSSLPFIPPSPS